MIPEPYYSIYEIILLLGGEVESVNQVGKQYSVRLIRTARVKNAAGVIKDIEVPQEFLIPPEETAGEIG